MLITLAQAYALRQVPQDTNPYIITTDGNVFHATIGYDDCKKDGDLVVHWNHDNTLEIREATP